MLRIQSTYLSYNPHLWLLAGFAIVILGGAFLLYLPYASTGTDLSYIDALFTATSAVCVTGLSTVDIGREFTLFGQIIILSLIQIGGLGFMTFAVFIISLFGKKLSWKQRIMMKESSKSSSYENLSTLAFHILLIATFFEGCSTFLLTVHWSSQLGWWPAFYSALFHSISAFNNAGFSLWDQNLLLFVGDPIVNLAITSLIIIGGLGFPVIIDLAKKRRLDRLTLHSKIVLTTTTILIVVGWFILLLLEHDNPGTMGELHAGERFWAAYFQSVTARTAGFNTLPIDQLHASSLFFLMVLMFIGASSGGTGGGIKTNTFVILVMAIRSLIHGEGDVHLFHRRINWRQIILALAVISIALVAIIIATIFLLWSEEGSHADFLPILFEVTSAFGTVGLSTGITADLSWSGKVVLIFMMFIGRLGPLTLAFAFTQRSTPTPYRYPEERVLIG